MSTTSHLKVLGAFAVVAASLPMWGSGYAVGLLTQVFLFGFLAAAWNFMALTGLVSLGHAAFFGVGAYATALLGVTLGASPILGAISGAALAMLLAAIVYWMAFRSGLRGIYFSGITLVLAEGLRFAAINSPLLGRSQGLGLTGAHAAPLLLYGLALALLVLTVAGTWWLLRSPLGYRLQAVRENERAAEALGVQTFRVKLIATLLSAGLVAIGGSLHAVLLRFVEPESDFGLSLSLNLLLGTFVGGSGTVFGPPVGVALLFGLREGIARVGEMFAIGSSEIYALQQVLYGAVLMLVVVALPDGIVPRLITWWRSRRGRATTAEAVAGGKQAEPATQVAGAREASSSANASAGRKSMPVSQKSTGKVGHDGSACLEVRNVSRSFSGLAALSDVSFDLHRGEILGLIGPNGAGKTTMFNVISGMFPPNSGEIRFNGARLTGLHPHQVCRSGVGRTFQIVQPFAGLTVLENAMIGALSRNAHIAEARRTAEAALAQVNLYAKRDLPAVSLTLQDRKMLEFARALATDPKLILLDEVMAGLTPSEQSQIADKILEIRDSGVSFLLVEHAMRAVMRLSDRIVVLDHGKLIASGLPSQVAANPEVISCYLGSTMKHVATTEQALT